MRLEVSSLRASGTTGSPSTLFSQWRVGTIVEAIAVRNAADGQLWLNIGATRVPARIASGDPAGPANGERLQLRVLRDRPVLALESIPQEDGETQLVNDGLRRFLPRQTSPAPLLANLALLAKNAPMLEALPRPIRNAVAQLWQSLPQATELATPEGLDNALRRSGVFLESTLAQSSDTEARTVLSRDIKGMLLDLKHALQRSGATPQAQATANSPTRAGPDPLPTMRGNLPPLPATSATLAQLDTLPDRLNELAAQTDGALARLRSVQLVNVENTTQAPVWLVELPFTRNQQPETLRFRFERNSSRQGNGSGGEQSWTVEASISLRDTGGLHARVSLYGSRIAVQLRAESASFVSELNARLPELTAVLREAGLDVDRVVCLHGMPAEDPQWRNPTPLVDLRA